MKKLVAISSIIILLLTGCAKQTQDPENILQAGTPSALPQQPLVDETLDPELNDPESQQSEPPASDENPSAIENAPALWGGSVPSFYDFPLSVRPNYGSFRIYSNFSDLKESLRASCYVFRGKKCGVSTQYVQTFPDSGKVRDFYSETPVQIIEPYYGLISENDQICLRERVAVFDQDNILSTIALEKSLPIENEKEYIFILSKYGMNQNNSEPLFTTYSGYYAIVETGILSELSEKIQNGSADDWDQFRFDLLSYYLNSPDTRLDLHHEASRYIENLSETASQEEILAALPEEQRALFTRLIAQYGVK